MKRLLLPAVAAIAAAAVAAGAVHPGEHAH